MFKRKISTRSMVKYYAGNEQRAKPRYQAIYKTGNAGLFSDSLEALQNQMDANLHYQPAAGVHILDTKTGEKFARRGRMWVKIK